MPEEVLSRDVSLGWEPREDVQEVLVTLHTTDPESALVCEALVDLDEGLGEWRYRHVKMVERTLGKKIGTGGSSGVGYLISTLFNPFFPDLWAMRSAI
jgi:tryptophan 2,3-dioxygenase